MGAQMGLPEQNWYPAQQFQNALPQGLQQQLGQYQQALGMLQAPADVWDQYLLANMSEEEFLLMRRGYRRGMDAREYFAQRDKESLKAQELLEKHLTREQRLDLEHYNYFDVEGKGKLKGRLGFRSMQTRRFRIHRNGPMIDEIRRDGKFQHLCIMALERLPREDVMLCWKLLIEADLPEFLRTANRIGALR